MTRFFTLPRIAGFLALLVQACAHAAPQVEVRMLAEVEAVAGPVLLGNAAVVRSTDLDAIAALVALPLGNAPAAGRETVLRRDSVARWVRTLTGMGAGSIAWTGADEVVVRGRDREKVGAAGTQAVIRRGDWAVLRARAGEVEIEDRVEVLQDGATGDRVAVRGTGSSASYMARVVERGVVEVER